MEKVDSSKVQYVVMLVFGLTMLAFSTWIAYEFRDYRHEIENTTGTVVKIVSEEIPSGGERERAEVEFTGKDGETHRFKIPLAGTFFDRAIGEKVTVVYDPAVPSNASVDGFWETWTLIMLCFVVSYLTVLLFRWVTFYIRYRGADE